MAQRESIQTLVHALLPGLGCPPLILRCHDRRGSAISIATPNLSEAWFTAAEAALTELETQFVGLIALDVARRRSLRQMGGKSETFCRQAVSVLSSNPKIVPESVPLADAVAGLHM